MLHSLIMNVSMLINKKEKTTEKAVHKTVTKERNSDYVRLKNTQLFFKVGSLSFRLKRLWIWFLDSWTTGCRRAAHFVLPVANSISWSTVAGRVVSRNDADVLYATVTIADLLPASPARQGPLCIDGFYKLAAYVTHEWRWIVLQLE